MPRHIAAPKVIAAAGTPPKRIEEFVGQANTGESEISIARMVSPEGWEEPGQTPQFAEWTVVLEGCLRVEHREGILEVKAGEAIATSPGEWVRYSTPYPGGAVYVAVCLPAFTPDTVRRDE